MKKILSFVKLLLFTIKWRKNNPNNSTYPGNVFNTNEVLVGKCSYGQLNVRKFGESKTKLIIKNYCSIANEVVFLLDGNHETNTISTFPFKQQLFGINGESKTNGDIVVDDDVWIGTRCLILSGTHIGQGAVIAAGAVVTKDIPPYAIAGGVPAKVIKYRFDSDIIGELLKLDYNNLTKEEIQSHIDDFYKPLTNKSQIDWMVKK